MDTTANLAKQVMQAGKESELTEVIVESEGMARKITDWISVSADEIRKQARVISD